MRRFSRQAIIPFRRLSFHRSAADLALDPMLRSYLEGANLFLSEMGDTGYLSAQLVQFPQITFARVQVPKVAASWPRDAMSTDRGLLIAVKRGRVSIDPSAPHLAASPGLFLIPPGDTHVQMRAHEPVNELIYISMSVAVLRSEPIPEGRESDGEPQISPDVLKPLFAFIDAMCAGTLDGDTSASVLRSSAIEVARSLVALIVDGDGRQPSVYDKAMRVIEQEYAKPRLLVAGIAAAVGVAERTLHAAFSERGTTVAGELRAQRVRAASEIRERNPDISRADLAMAAGFGSISAMQRAFRHAAN